jgi:hypothetical protein
VLQYDLTHCVDDPRDIVVSAYFSAFTHREVLDLAQNRALLDSLPLDEGLSYVMKNGELFEGDTLNQVWPRQIPLAPLWWWNDQP